MNTSKEGKNLQEWKNQTPTPKPPADEWKVVEGKLKLIGVVRPQAANAAAKQNGFNAPQVLALIAWFQLQPHGAYTPGVLVDA